MDRFQADVFEEDLGGVLRVEAQLLEQPPPPEPVHPLLDQDEADVARIGGVRLRRHDEEVADDALGDVGLRAPPHVAKYGSQAQKRRYPAPPTFGLSFE